MSFSHEYNFPVFISTGSVLTSGSSADLGKGQLGIINGRTYQIVSGPLEATTPLKLAQGSFHMTDKLGQFVGGLTQSDKSPEFLLKDILQFERSKPRKAIAEQWILGWDGTNDCGSLSFETGKTYRYSVKVWGEDVYGMFLKPIQREISYSVAPNAEGTNVAVGTKEGAQAIAKLINEDPELKYFVRAEAIHSDYAATTATHHKVLISVPDTGDAIALAAISGAYPALKLTRTDRKGIISTYEGVTADSGGNPVLPADFTPGQEILLASCGTCPSGYTTVSARDAFIVQRAVSSTTDLNSDADRATFAAAVVTDYSGITGTGRFLSNDAGVARVEFKKAASTTTPTPVLSDVITKTNTMEAICTPPAGTAIDWVAGDALYTKTRKLCVTLPKVCNTGNRLTEVQAFYASTPGLASIALETAGTCSDTYSLVQTSSNFLEDACLSEDQPEFTAVQSFEGFVWETCPCLAEDLGDTTVKSGVRLTAAYENTKFGGCSFNPSDYYSVRPLKLEVVELVHGPGVFDAGVLPVSPTPSRLSRHSSMATQGGEWLIREKIRADRYRVHAEFYHDSRLREVLDSNVLDIVDRDASYTTYHLKVRQNREGQNHEGDFNPEILEFVIAFKEGIDASAFETAVQTVTAQNRVFLKDR